MFNSLSLKNACVNFILSKGIIVIKGYVNQRVFKVTLLILQTYEAYYIKNNEKKSFQRKIQRLIL